MKKFILISMVLLCLVTIFMFSHENAEVSMNTTIKVSNVINVNSDNFHILRKSGHFLEFFILELLILCAISSFKRINFQYFIITLLFCLIYACSDEIHQLFVVGRNANIMDVCIDFCGSVFGGLFFSLFNYIYNEGFVR